MLKNMNTYESDERGEKTGGEIKRMVSLGFCGLAFTSFNERSFVLSASQDSSLPSAYSELAIASSFPLQIKDQSLNMLFSFSIRL